MNHHTLIALLVAATSGCNSVSRATHDAEVTVLRNTLAQRNQDIDAAHRDQDLAEKKALEERLARIAAEEEAKRAVLTATIADNRARDVLTANELSNAQSAIANIDSRIRVLDSRGGANSSEIAKLAKQQAELRDLVARSDVAVAELGKRADATETSVEDIEQTLDNDARQRSEAGKRLAEILEEIGLARAAEAEVRP